MVPQGSTNDPRRRPLAILHAKLGLDVPLKNIAGALEEAVHPVRFSAGEALVLEEGEVEDEMFLILEGMVRLERSTGYRATTVAILGPGEVAGEAHLLHGDAGTDRVVALKPVEALAISRTALEKAASEPGAELLLRVLELRSKAARLKASTPLSALQGPALLELAGRIEEEHSPAGSVLLAPNEEPGRMTFLRAGSASVLAGEEDDRRVVAELLPGDSFGEAALLGGAAGLAPHAPLAVEAATDVELYHLWPEVLDRVLAEHPEAGAAIERQVAGLSVVAFLRHSGPFAGCDTATLHHLAAAMEERSYLAGADLVREGEEGHAYYLVTRGRVRLDVDETDGVKELDTLEPGGGFGAGVLLGEGPYTFTATAIEETGVLALKGDVFREVVEEHGNVFRRVRESLSKHELPMRIADWSAARQETAEGEVLYVIKDEERGRYYKVSERGFFLWEQMDGNTSLRDLVMAYTLRYKSFSVEGVIGLVEALKQAGFVRVQGMGQSLLKRGEIPAPLVRLGHALRGLLYFTVPLRGFDPAVSALYRWAGWVLYTRFVLLLFATLAASGLGVSGYLLFSDALPSWQPAADWGFVAYYGLLAGLIVLHELSHALTVKSYGREVRRAGFGFVFATPFLYVDTSDMWMDTRRARIAVSWAGPYMHLIFGSAAAWALLLVPGLRENGFAVTFLVVNYLFVVANLFPLLEFDGYYMLMDYLEVPSLRQKALAFVGGQLRRPTSPLRWSRIEKIFAGFGLISGVYVVFIVFQLLLFARFFVGYYAGILLGSTTGSVVGWVVGALLALLLLWPSVKGWRRNVTAGT
ncbi:MAG: PqqD family peptide modification chaperone [Actinomycetota bacterium]|nr:PqqD family peptide modification chaperone [Actinomycetota bacterium]